MAFSLNDFFTETLGSVSSDASFLNAAQVASPTSISGEEVGASQYVADTSAFSIPSSIILPSGIPNADGRVGATTAGGYPTTINGNIVLSDGGFGSGPLNGTIRLEDTQTTNVLLGSGDNYSISDSNNYLDFNNKGIREITTNNAGDMRGRYGPTVVVYSYNDLLGNSFSGSASVDVVGITVNTQITSLIVTNTSCSGGLCDFTVSILGTVEIYTAGLETNTSNFSVSGQVTDTTGASVNSGMLNLNGETYTSSTDIYTANVGGNYSYTDVPEGTYSGRAEMYWDVNFAGIVLEGATFQDFSEDISGGGGGFL